MADAKIGTFDVLREMVARNMDVRLSTLDNITDLELKEGNTFIRIGFSGDVLNPISRRKMIGGMLLADNEQFQAIKKELEERLRG